MKTCILMASPRKKGNTAALMEGFCSELKRMNEEFTYHYLYDMEIDGCVACRRCQQDWSGFNCFKNDDMQQIAEDILDSDLLMVLHTAAKSCYGPACLRHEQILR